MKCALYLSAAAIVAAASPVFAQVSFGEDVMSHRIIPGWVNAQGQHVAALEITLAPGWKTYWRVPGDAGIPPRFLWDGTGNLNTVDVQWPTPDVFWQHGLRSVGYKDRVVLPLVVHPTTTGQDITLQGRMDLGLCADVCIPASFEFSGTLTASSSAPKPAAIVAALATLPYSASEAGVTAARCAFQPSQTGMSIEAKITLPPTGSPEEAVIEAPMPGVWVSDPKTDRQGNTLTLRANMVSASDTPPVVNRSDVRITVIGGNYSVDIQGCTG